jgi:DNA-binding MarR family transcriptional regulator
MSNIEYPATNGESAPGGNRFALSLAVLLEQVARNIYPERAPTDMHPGQWAALRYFARANKEACTVAGLARYLGVTAGPSSRAITALERKGLVVETADPRDRRVRRIQVSAAGHDLLQADPILRAAALLSELPSGQIHALAEGLGVLQMRLAGDVAAEEADPFRVPA